MSEIFNGFCRVYFNAKGEAPLVWSVDRGDQSTEVNVREINFHLLTTPWKTVFVERENRRWPSPAGWLEGEGIVEITDEGVAHIWS